MLAKGRSLAFLCLSMETKEELVTGRFLLSHCPHHWRGEGPIETPYPREIREGLTDRTEESPYRQTTREDHITGREKRNVPHRSYIPEREKLPMFSTDEREKFPFDHQNTLSHVVYIRAYRVSHVIAR